MIIIATTAQVIILNENALSRSRGEVRYFYNWLIEDTITEYGTGEDYHRFVRVFDIDQLNKTLQDGFEVFLY